VGGLLFDQFGDYRVFLWLLVAAAAGAGLLFFLSPPPQRSLSAAHGAASTVPAEPAA
jgi:nitrate/nitrite transporter NarK